MSYAIELIDGKPGRVIADTVDDLRAVLALNGYAEPRATRTKAVRETNYHARPWSAKRKTAKRASKPKPKTGARTSRATRTKKRNGGAGWTQAVYDRAEAKGISPTIARREIAAEKQAAKPATAKRKPK
jgi:hypothetical protein